MGNCLKRKSAVEVEPPAAPAPCYSDASSSDSETKCKRVRFNAQVEVFGRGIDGYPDHEELKFDQEEEKKVEKMEQVKIRISKKQLEELLEKVEVKSMSHEEMMSCLVEEI